MPVLTGARRVMLFLSLYLTAQRFILTMAPEPSVVLSLRLNPSGTVAPDAINSPAFRLLASAIARISSGNEEVFNSTTTYLRVLPT